MSNPVDIQIELNKQDFSKIAAQIQRAQTVLNIPLKQAVQMARYYIASSLAATTKVAAKLRKVVPNPDQKAKTDGRMAKFGVMKYDRNGNEYFAPIYRTGEFGKIRFPNKKTAEWLVRDPVTGEVSKASMSTGTDEFQVPGIMQDKRRIIGRSGLAKKSWQWAQSRTGEGNIFNVSSIAVRWSGGEEDPTITIFNRLRYAGAAFKTEGEQTLDNVMERAHRKMQFEINRKIAREMGVA